jgi:aminopeptidase-like protein
MLSTEHLVTLDNIDDSGKTMYGLARELFPICRSITGDGVRESLRIIQGYVSLEMHEVPTGTEVFDWVVPREWNIVDACILDSDGNRIIDFKDCNLHVVNYSIPVNQTMSLGELKEHLHTLPDNPEWIPYRTSYYQENWGFCLSHNQMHGLQDDTYKVMIDSSLKDGHLTYGEFVHEGASRDEVLLTAHICHPSLANDNLSGICVLTWLAAWISQQSTRYTYRFLWIPGTIGSITWLALNHDKVNRIRHGLVITCVGDGGGPVYKRSRQDNTDINRVMEYVLNSTSSSSVIEDFSPYGYDERQFCSPGFNLPMGLLQRSKHGQYPQYHTSADNLDYIKPEHLTESLKVIIQAIGILENDAVFINNNPHCEPQLGKRGLYETMGGDKRSVAGNMALLWVLNQSDGDNSLLDIAEKSNIGFDEILRAAGILENAGLLRRPDPSLS